MGKIIKPIALMLIVAFMFNVVLPVGKATAEVVNNKPVISLEADCDETSFCEKEANRLADNFLRENGIFDIDYNQLSEEEIETFFEELVSKPEYQELEATLNNMYLEQNDGTNQEVLRAGPLLPAVFVGIGIIALRMVIVSGGKVAQNYLKKAVKNYIGQYKISFPNTTNQLILVQNKKNNTRLFSIDKHSVKLVHKTTGKGYNGAFNVWHFHKDTGHHYVLCSSLPQGYKVQFGACF
ncbi:hypothetical protein [Bacillus cereus]|uniref:hypothetical protein n=1 Tax=Bacillus cereus TaxID=1396 RepID=UPI000995032A|nr:hypothetical protein [Bacillus cereus]OOZ84167.1 hypothetical protein BHL49_28120 [Bacillus cereus]